MGAGCLVAGCLVAGCLVAGCLGAGCHVNVATSLVVLYGHRDLPRSASKCL